MNTGATWMQNLWYAIGPAPAASLAVHPRLLEQRLHRHLYMLVGSPEAPSIRHPRGWSFEVGRFYLKTGGKAGVPASQG